MRVLFIVLVILSILPVSLSARELVLVGNTFSINDVFKKRDLRKMFLGYRVSRDNNSITAIRNTQSVEQYQIFLQKVMFMSKTDYERRCLTLNFSKGNRKVEEEKDQKALFKILKHNPFMVTYMWRDELEEDEDIGVLQILWKGRS